MKRHFPPGWDEARVKRVLKHYESQTEDQAVAEDEAWLRKDAPTVMRVPLRLVPQVRRMIAQHARRRKRAI